MIKNKKMIARQRSGRHFNRMERIPILSLTEKQRIIDREFENLKNIPNINSKPQTAQSTKPTSIVEASNLKPAAVPWHLVNDGVTHGIGYKMIDIRENPSIGNRNNQLAFLQTGATQGGILSSEYNLS
jgi:hypothetical protein